MYTSKPATISYTLFNHSLLFLLAAGFLFLLAIHCHNWSLILNFLGLSTINQMTQTVAYYGGNQHTEQKYLQPVHFDPCNNVIPNAVR